MDFFDLPDRDRVDFLTLAAESADRPVSVLEKDVWVVWTLRHLFSASIGEHLTFKGGTSLSKAYRLIDRFSEDVDLTVDIRALVPELPPPDPLDPLPLNRSQADRWSRTVRDALPHWIEKEILPVLAVGATSMPMPPRIERQDDRVLISYASDSPEPSDYIEHRVLLEFGWRASGEPAERILTVCDVELLLRDTAVNTGGIRFPTAEPRVLDPRRTFWEKATAIHVFILRGALNGDRLSRHWYDLMQLHRHGVTHSAIADRALGEAVARHKTMFFRTNDAEGRSIDYLEAVRRGLRLIPRAPLRDRLMDDYRRMVEGGMLSSPAPSFDEVLDTCAQIEEIVREGAD